MNEVSLKSTKAELFKKVCDLKEQVETTVQDLTVANNKYEDANRTNSRLVVEIKTVNSNINSKDETIKFREAQIANLRKTIDALNHTIETKKTELENEKANNIIKLKHKDTIISARDNTINSLVSEANVYKTTIKRYKRAFIISSIVAIAVCILAII